MLKGGKEFLPPQALQQPVPFQLQPAPVPGAGDERGIVGQDRQERRLAPAQGLGAAAEIKPGRRVDAHDVATERGVGRVQVQELPFREGEFEAQGQDHFADLFQVGAPWVLAGEAHHLHGQGAAAAGHPPFFNVRPQGAGDRPRVDAAMAVEAAVLVLQQRLEKALRDRLHPGEAPLLVGGQAGAQEAAVGREQHRRKRVVEKPPRQAHPEQQAENEQQAAQQQEGAAPLAKKRLQRTISTHLPVLLAW